MARYIDIKGWLECDFINVELIKNSINNVSKNCVIPKDIATLYLSGWVFPDEEKSWSSYIFYGMSIKTYTLDFFEAQLTECLKNDIELSGSFFIQDDEEENFEIWKVNNFEITKNKLDKLSHEYILPF